MSGMTRDDFHMLALSLPFVEERQPFGHVSFHVRAPGNRVFAALPLEGVVGHLRVDIDMQELLVSEGPMFSPAPEGAERRCWTMIHLDIADEESARAALALAWRNAAPKTMRPLIDTVLLGARQTFKAS